MLEGLLVVVPTGEWALAGRKEDAAPL